MPYTREGLECLKRDYETILSRADQLTTSLVTWAYATAKAKEFAIQGAVRRLDQMEHALRRVFSILPPDMVSPRKEEIMDATAHLQTFIFNAFGTVDNLAHVWCAEVDLRDPDNKNVALRGSFVGLGPGNKAVRNSLPKVFADYLQTEAVVAWFEHLEDYRHALAHRIPLYIVRQNLNDADGVELRRLDQEKITAAANHDYKRVVELTMAQMALGKYDPLMTHSFSEHGGKKGPAEPRLFHPQMLSDLTMVVEIGERVFLGLDEKRQSEA